MAVGEREDDRGGLDQEGPVVLDHRDPAERVALAMLVGLAVGPLHHLELVGRTDLLEHPQHARRAAREQVVEAGWAHQGVEISTAPKLTSAVW